MFYLLHFLEFSCETDKSVCMEEAKKLSVAQCIKILEENGDTYSDEQVLKIRDVLYILGELDYLILKEIKLSDSKSSFDHNSDKAA